jgi:uncharacterized protein (TIGR03086 family)
MTAEVLQVTCARTREIIASVGPEMYGRGTPCQLWDVRRLINHTVGATRWVTDCVRTGEALEHGPYEEVDYTVGDVLKEYDAAVEASIDVFDSPGALTKSIALPGVTLSGDALLGILIDDQFIHGWDLAKATGQPLTDADQQMAERLLAAHETHPIDQFRGPEGKAPYGARVEVPPSAPATDRLAGFFGRMP